MGSEVMVGILVVALAISEGLALMPQLKSNSILQLIINGLKALVPDEREPKVK